jgi:hypothetical protein
VLRDVPTVEVGWVVLAVWALACAVFLWMFWER